MKKNFLKAVIGLEIHLELKTKEKLFSSQNNIFSLSPNIHVSAIDLGYPGTLPYFLSEEVIFIATKLSFLLKMKISNFFSFDRKHYFYFDLPKGYQITQHYFPFAKNGKLKIEIGNYSKKFKIKRLQIEEDTARQITGKKEIFLDFNRSGIPLIEIVSEPIFETAEEVVAFLEKIRKICLWGNISDAKMNEGSLRCDVNISIVDESGLQTKRVEIKNLNSFRFIKKAINFEVEYQKKYFSNLIATEKNFKEKLLVTKKYDEKLKKNVFLRKKHSFFDYFYFQDPNFIFYSVPKKIREKAKKELSEHSTNLTFSSLALEEKFLLTKEQLSFIVKKDYFLKKYLEVVKDFQRNTYLVFNRFFVNSVLFHLKKKNLLLEQTFFDIEKFKKIIYYYQENIDTIFQAKEKIFFLLTNKNFKVKDSEDCVFSIKKIESIIDALIKEEITALKDIYLTFDEKKAVNFLMGRIIRQTKGTTKPQLIIELIRKKLGIFFKKNG